MDNEWGCIFRPIQRVLAHLPTTYTWVFNEGMDSTEINVLGNEETTRQS